MRLKKECRSEFSVVSVQLLTADNSLQHQKQRNVSKIGHDFKVCLRGLNLLFLHSWKNKGEDRTMPRLANDFHRAIVAICNMFHNGKS